MEPNASNECAQNATNEIYILDESGAARYLHPYGTDKVPSVYGHLSALVEDSTNSLAEKKIYYFGGRLGTSDSDNWSYCSHKSTNFGLCTDIFTLIVPSTPLKLTSWASSNSAAVWKRIDYSGSLPSSLSNSGIIFGNMAYESSLNMLLIFNGYREEDSTTWDSKESFLLFNLNNNTWNMDEISTSADVLPITSWDGSVNNISFESPTMGSKLNSFFIFEPDTDTGPNNISGSVQIFGGVGYTSYKEVVNYYETWFQNLKTYKSIKIEDV